MSVFKDTWELNIDDAIERDLKAIDKQLSKMDHSFNDVEKEAKQASKAIHKTTKETKKAGKAGENASKAFEGMAQGMGVSAISGERLANVWLAAGAAVGALIGSVGILASKSLSAYIKKNVDAKNAVDRLDKAQTRFLETLGAAIFAEEKGVTTLDSFAGKLDQLSGSVKKNEKAIRGFAEGMVTATDAVVMFYTSGLQLATFPVLGFIDLIKAAGGVVINFGLGIVETWAQVAKAAGLLPDSMKEVIGFTDGMQDNVTKMTDITDGLVVSLHHQMDGLRGLSGDLAGAAKGTKDFTGSAQKAEQALQEFQGPLKNWTDDINTGTKSVKRLDSALADLAKQAATSATKVGGIFGMQLKEASDAADKAQRLHLMSGGLSKTQGTFDLAANEIGQESKRDFKNEAAPAAAANLEELGLGPGGAFETGKAQVEALDGAFEDFAKGGVMLAVDSLGQFVEGVAAGNLSASDFGKGALLAAADMLEQLGQSAVAAGLIGEWFQKGGLIEKPAVGVALGIAAIVLANALSGGLSRGSGGGGGGGSGRGAAAARKTTRAIEGVRNKQDDRDEAPMIVYLDGAVVGRATRSRNAQSARRGEFQATTAIQRAR